MAATSLTLDIPREGATSAVPPDSVPVLMYHEISEPAHATWGHLAVSPAAFREQVSFLLDSGYTTLTAGGLASLLAEGGKVPPRPVILTFDDGFEDFHRHAVPELAERGCTATVFVTTSWVQDAGSEPATRRPGRMLSWSQITEAVDAGFEAGAHSCQHPQLDQVSAARLHDELYISKAELEDQLGVSVPGLAYPYGYSNPIVRRVAREAGYAYGYAVRNTMTAPGADLFRLPRLTIHGATDLQEFRRLVEGRLAMSMVRDRALTAAWSMVRTSRSVVAPRKRDANVTSP
jgi:peptidoglycan/xylan/chitin deacetylase (PgdA/CDA1 family)